MKNFRYKINLSAIHYPRNYIFYNTNQHDKNQTISNITVIKHLINCKLKNHFLGKLLATTLSFYISIKILIDELLDTFKM